MARKKEEERISANFIIDKAPQYHKAWAVQSRYSHETAEFESTSAGNDVLRLALEDYNATADEKRRLNIQHCTFDDVLLELAEAEGKYNNKAKGIAGIGRRGGRFAGDNSDVFTPWIGLIPSDHGLSFLSAGLTVIFSIAKHNAENRGKILQAFREIPYIILRTRDQQQQFASDKRLQQQAVELYKTLVQSLADLILLFSGKSRSKWKDRATKIVAPTYTGGTIEKILGNVQSSAKLFQDGLELVKAQSLKDTQQNTTAILAQGDCIRTSNGNIERNVAEIRTSEIRLENQLGELCKQFREMRAEKCNQYQLGIDSQNFLQVFIRDDFPKPGISQPHIQPFQPHSFMSDIELFNSLSIPHRQAIDDIDQILQRVNQFDVSAQAQAQQLLSTQQFTKWMGFAHSETLLVQGNFHMTGPGRISPLSALCATLSLNLSRNTECIVLHFFCGLHEAPGNPVLGPNGLIRSLIAQLLLTGFQFELHFINTRSFLEHITSHSIQDLCTTFRELIEQLPPAVTVVCIIDSVTRFEFDSWSEELLAVIHILNLIICNPALRPVVKLMATTPFTNSKFIEQAMQGHQSVHLQPVAVGGQRMSERNIRGGGRSLEDYRLKMQIQEEQSEDEEDF